MAADVSLYSNIPGTYGAFLNNWDSRALKTLTLDMEIHKKLLCHSDIVKNKTYLTMVTFHPAYLLRQPDQKKYSWLDLKKIKKKIDEEDLKL